MFHQPAAAVVAGPAQAIEGAHLLRLFDSPCPDLASRAVEEAVDLAPGGPGADLGRPPGDPLTIPLTAT